MPSSAKCLQLLLVIFIGIFFISAVAVIVLNCMFLYKLMSYNSFIHSDILLPSILLLVLGFLSLFFAWVGWRSAWSLHRVHVIIFGIFLLLVVVMELGFSIWSLVIWDNMHGQITDAVEQDFRTMMNKTEADDSLVRKWEKIQNELQCCGVGGPSDYRSTTKIPWSCCSRSSIAVDASSSHIGDCGTIYQRGCFGPLYQVARDVMLYICLLALGAGLIHALGLPCVFYLQAAIGRPMAVVVRRPSEASTSTRRRAPQPPKATSAARALLPSEAERY